MLTLITGLLATLPMSPASAVASNPQLAQSAFVWQNDDGSAADGNSDQASANTAITNVGNGERLDLRIQLENTGTAVTTSQRLGLFYDRNDGYWRKVQPGGAAVTSAGSCDDTKWTCTAIDTTETVDNETSIAFDKAGTPWIAYMDAGSNNDVWVAHYVGAGGSGCASSAWSCVLVDDTGTAGQYVSIAIAPNGTPWISYYGNSDLRVAYLDGDTTASGCTGTGTASWTCIAADNTASVGGHTSIAFDSTGKANVAYQNDTGDLKVAAYNTGTTAGCGNAFTCSTVHNTANTLAVNTSIAFAPDGKAWISYQDSTSGDLWWAENVGGSGGNCTLNSWNCGSIETTGTTGLGSSIAFASDGTAWISYIDSTNNQLRVARYVSSSGTGCSSSSAWTCTAVVSGSGTIALRTSIAFGPDGNAWVTYGDTTGGTTPNDLKLARYVGGSSGSGCTSNAWTCTTIQSSGSVGTYSALGFDPLGHAWVSYVDNATDLRVATVVRGGEIIAAPGLAGANGDAIDSADAGSCSTWNDGRWAEDGDVTNLDLDSGTGTTQCTEVGFSLDTSQATASATYRFVVAIDDGRLDKSIWRGPSTVGNYPSLTMASAAASRFAKDTTAIFADCGGDATWGCTSIDAAQSNMGAYAKAAVDPDGNPWIVSKKGDTMHVVRYVGSGGSGCTSASAQWSCEAIEADYSGFQADVAFGPDGTAWVSWIAADGKVHVGHYVGDGSGTGCAYGSTNWTCAILTTGSSSDYSSITVDRNGTPWVAYIDSGVVKVGYYVGSGGTGCNITSWNCYTVDSRSTWDLQTAIGADPISGKIWIGYYSADTAGRFTVAWYVGAGGSCSHKAWSCGRVDNTNDNTGKAVDVAFDSSGYPWFSYFDTTNDNVRYARYSPGTGASGVCAANWVCGLALNQSSVAYTQEQTSIAFDATGAAWIVANNWTNDRVMIARHVGSSGSGCGSGISAWTCTTPHSNDGCCWYPTLTFDRSGVPWIFNQISGNGLGVYKADFSTMPLSRSIINSLAGGNARTSEGRYRLDWGDTARPVSGVCSAASNAQGYCGAVNDDTSYDGITAQANESPLLTFAYKGSSSDLPTATWIGRTSYAASSGALTLQVYEFGSTNAWQTVTTETTCSANTDCTISGTATGTAADFYQTVGPDTFVYWRLHQEPDASNSITLKTDLALFTPMPTAPLLTQNSYIWQNDDGTTVNNASTQAGTNSSISDVGTRERVNVRLQIGNTGAGLPDEQRLALFYDRNDGFWTKVRPAIAPVTSSGTCSNTSFSCTAIDTGETVTNETSVAFDGTGRPWIAYMDAGSNNDLWVAQYVGSGGSGCASSAWRCVLVDNTATAGQHASIAIGPGDVPWISYYGNDNLRVAYYAGSGGSCSNNAWVCVAADSTATAGMHTSIAFDSTGKAWVAYKGAASGSTSSLRVAKYASGTTSGCGNAFTCETVHTITNSTIAVDTSLAFDHEGNSWVSYHDSTGNDLWVARYKGGATTGNCTLNTWDCTLVENTGSTGTSTSIAFAPDGKAWVSYIDVTNNQLRVAYYDGDGSSSGCSNSVAWTCTAVVSGTGTIALGTSIAFAPDGHAWITYGDTTGGTTPNDLELARHVGGSSGSGCTSSAWSCVTIESTGSVGTYSSLGFDAAGQPVISYVDNATDLRFAKLNREGEILPTGGLSGNTGDSVTSAATGSCSTWSNGKWSESGEVRETRLGIGSINPQCSEFGFALDTSQAQLNTTYRFVLAIDEGVAGRSMWRGPVTTTQYAMLTTASSYANVYAKGTTPNFANCANDITWGCMQIDGTALDDVGSNAAAAVDPDGTPWVVYQNTDDQTLMAARYVGIGGTGCATGTTLWTCEIVDDLGSGYENNTIRFGSDGTAWVAYFHNQDSELRLAHRVGGGNGMGCGSTTDWTCEVVDDGSPELAAMTLDKNGNPWIAYRGSASPDDLRIAHRVGSGGSGCGAGSPAWTCEVVDNGAISGMVSIAIDPNGKIWIAYYDNIQETKVAWYVGTGGNCTHAAWSCKQINTAVGGNANAIAIDPSGNPWIVWIDSTSFGVHYARYDGDGSASGCIAGANDWTCGTVDDADVNASERPAIAFDRNGDLWVSYLRYDTDERLTIARHTGSGGTGCNNGSPEWTCFSPHATSSWAGSASAITFDHFGAPWIFSKTHFGGTADLFVTKLHTSTARPNTQVSPNTLGNNAVTTRGNHILDWGDTARPVSGACSAASNKGGYCAVATDDTDYDATTAQANEVPSYTFISSSASTAAMPSARWVGRTSLAASTKNISLEVYKFGSTNAWTTATTEGSCSANVDCTIGGSGTGTASDYYETVNGTNYVYWRVRQLANTGGTITFTTDEIKVPDNQAPTSATNLTQKRSNGTTTISSGGWTNETTVVLGGDIADVDNPDSVQLCVEVKPLATSFDNTGVNCSTLAAYSGSALTHSVTISGLTDGAKHWRAQTRDVGGLASSWVFFGGSDTTHFSVDATAPTGSTVNDGTVEDVDAGYNDGSLDQLSANWDGFADSGSGVDHYDYSIGTTPGGTNVRTWTNITTNLDVTATSLTLRTGQRYYVNVRATDVAGNTTTVSSNGQLVAPTLTFSVAPAAITLGPLNLGNSFTDSDNVVLATSTNAYNGYTVTGALAELPNDGGGNTIGHFDGGTYASPSSWTASNKGVGYTSDDTSVDGSNRFAGGTLYAPFQAAGIGDVVADHTSVVSGTPITNEQFTITVRVQADGATRSGAYATSMTFTAVAQF